MELRGGHDVLKITGDTIPGPLLANKQSLNAVTLVGGCDTSFNQIPGSTTTILGMVVVQNYHFVSLRQT